MPRPQDRVEFSLEGPQLAGVVAGALVTLAVVFALGVGFGRQLSTAPAAAAPPTDLSRLDAPTPAPVQDTGFTFHDSLAKASPPPVVAKPAAAPIEAPKEAPKPVAADVKAPEPQAQPAPAPIAAEPVAPAPAPTKDDAVPKADPPKPAVAAPVAATPPPVEKKITAPVEPPKPAAPKEAGGWCVQFGASPSRADADKLASTLHGFGYTSYVVVADIPGKGRYYRVRVGHFGSKEEADQLRTDASGAHKQLQPGVVMPAR